MGTIVHRWVGLRVSNAGAPNACGRWCYLWSPVALGYPDSQEACCTVLQGLSSTMCYRACVAMCYRARGSFVITLIATGRPGRHREDHWSSRLLGETCGFPSKCSPWLLPKHLVGDISDAALRPNDPNFTGLTFNVIKWK